MYIKKKIFQNGTIIPSNYHIDINLKTDVGYEFNTEIKKGLLLYPQIKLFFYPNGYIYLYHGNYLNYKSKQFGPNIGVESADYKYIISDDFDTNLSESYYSFTDGVLYFYSNNSLYKSWKLQLNSENKTNLNLYLTNFNSKNINVSNLNFKIIFSSSDNFQSNENNIYLNCSFGYFDFGPINLIENTLVLNKYLIKNYAMTNLKNNFIKNFEEICPKKIITELNKNFLTYNCDFLPILINPYKIKLSCEFKNEYIKKYNACSKNYCLSSNSSSDSKSYSYSNSYSSSNSSLFSNLKLSKKKCFKKKSSSKIFFLTKLFKYFDFLSSTNIVVYFLIIIGIVLFIIGRKR